ncbi:hypothetical protein EZV62_004906 [Acer yangbiense]|uniref:DEAD/DEAH-box helicase domain-containing protein n=1 Tax=Acer yangbiense TaxID=1000413 RepID=A0A5C7IL91_9ROSI|nr:hypothetical protein EZV62_004906 [Acer yangbiense]
MREEGYPELRALLCIGGVDMRSQLEVVRKGVHIVVATPGRLKDMLVKKKMNLDNCRDGGTYSIGDRKEMEMVVLRDKK